QSDGGPHARPVVQADPRRDGHDGRRIRPGVRPAPVRGGHPDADWDTARLAPGYPGEYWVGGETRPKPPPPTGTLTFFGLVVIVALLVNYRIIPPADNTGGVAGASAAPAPSGAPGPSGAAPPAASAPTADVTIVASGVQYTTTTATAPAGTPFPIAFN